MKVITASLLQDLLDAELVWRRREISSLVTALKGAGPAEQLVCVRAGIPLLYAHWEGFGRACFERYLEFVSYRRLRFNQLKPSFLFLYASGRLKGMQSAGHRESVELLREIVEGLDQTNKDTYRKHINTQSNLRSGVLKDLLALCGLNCSHFDSEADFIDRELCDPRNEIAHGSGGAPELSIFIHRRDKAFLLMANLQGLIVNAALAEEYKR
jgi:hypothetical protein